MTDKYISIYTTGTVSNIHRRVSGPHSEKAPKVCTHWLMVIDEVDPQCNTFEASFTAGVAKYFSVLTADKIKINNEILTIIK